MSSAALVRASDQVSATDLRLPAPIDKSAMRSYLAVLEDPEALQLQNRLAAAYDAACTALIGPNDVQVEGARSFKKKSAWRKLARYFGISTAIIAREERFINDTTTGETVFVSSCTVRAMAPWGQVNEAIGACGTDEETGRRKITIADSIGTAETRATNRAISNLIAMGEVSAEEASRGERENVVREAAKEMTLEQAGAVTFPWRQPEKYRDKPLSALSTKMLNTVLEAVKGEIEKSGETPRRTELKFACEMLIKARPAGDEQKAEPQQSADDEQRTDPTTTSGESNASTTGSAPADSSSSDGKATSVTSPTSATGSNPTELKPGKIEDALDKPTPVPEATRLTKRLNFMYKDEKFESMPDELAGFKARQQKAETVEDLKLLVAEVETFISLPF